MEQGTIMILIAIGISAGILSGFVGVGGGMVIVPALIYFLGLSQFEAQGTSLALMLPPIGILGFWNYYQAKHVDTIHLKYALIIAVTFVVGGWLGSRLSLKLDEKIVRLIFGALMLYVSIKMIWGTVAEMYQNHGS